MRFPDRKEPSRSLMQLGRYAAARVKADPDTAALASHVEEPLAALGTALAARARALDAQVGAEAVRDFQLAQTNRALVALAHLVLVEFSERDHAEYVRLFPTAPSLLARTPERDRARVYSELVKKAEAKETPTVLRPGVRKLRSAWDALVEAEDRLRSANTALERARADEAAARDGWNVGYRRLHARLVAEFPTDKDRVEGYFRRPGPARRAPAKIPTEPAIHGAEPVPPEVLAALGDDDAAK